MIYELRVYQCVPGKLPALLKRFEDHTLKIWEKHGIRPAGFWTVLIGDGSNDLHYLLAWESLAEREKVWGTFQVDPAWIKVRDGHRERRSDHRQCQKLVPQADSILVGEVIFARVIPGPSAARRPESITTSGANSARMRVMDSGLAA